MYDTVSSFWSSIPLRSLRRQQMLSFRLHRRRSDFARFPPTSLCSDIDLALSKCLMLLDHSLSHLAGAGFSECLRRVDIAAPVRFDVWAAALARKMASCCLIYVRACLSRSNSPPRLDAVPFAHPRNVVRRLEITGPTGPTSSPYRLPAIVSPGPSGSRLSPDPSPKRSPSLPPPLSLYEFPVSSHGARRLSTIHREGLDRPPSPNGIATGDSETNGSAVPWDMGHGGPSSWRAQKHGRGFLVHYTGYTDWHPPKWLWDRRYTMGDVGRWTLTAPWNGSTLRVEASHLSDLMRRPMPRKALDDGPLKQDGISMRDRRSERLLSLSGRAPFPSVGASISVPTHPPLGYVEIHPFARKGEGSIIAGFGNRLGVISLSKSLSTTDTIKSSTGSTIAKSLPPPRRKGSIMDIPDGLGTVK